MMDCSYCGKTFHSLGIMRHRKACREKLKREWEKHGIDCDCKMCQKIRGFLKQKEKKGKINLVGCGEDLEKIRK